MKTPIQILRRAVISGSCASLASTAALVHGGIRDCRSAIAPVNAVSHWLWDDRALYQHRPSLRYSVLGYAIHHAASIFWAIAYEGLSLRSTRLSPRQAAAAHAASVAALACVVDMQCTPRRFTPGFERRLSKKSLAGVYAVFGLGLALHTLLSSRK
ncbi:MAG TPA: hypothetical protein VNS29_12540 [Burkholderiaceae bacterium]|nr:hypothetical protein [Burkholderiaceae bacterium]